MQSVETEPRCLGQNVPRNIITSYIGASSVVDSSPVPHLLPIHYNIITLTNILVRELFTLIISYNNTDIGNKGFHIKQFIFSKCSPSLTVNINCIYLKCTTAKMGYEHHIPASEVVRIFLHKYNK